MLLHSRLYDFRVISVRYIHFFARFQRLFDGINNLHVQQTFFTGGSLHYGLA